MQKLVLPGNFEADGPATDPSRVDSLVHSQPSFQVPASVFIVPYLTSDQVDTFPRNKVAVASAANHCNNVPRCATVACLSWRNSPSLLHLSPVKPVFTVALGQESVPHFYQSSKRGLTDNYSVLFGQPDTMLLAPG